MILATAGAGICGIDRNGFFTFVNRTAAEMLGFEVEELIGRASHPVLHHSRTDHSLYPAEQCPIHAGYTLGIASQGEDEYYWRKDNTAFPIQYVTSPIYDDGVHTGAVLVFRDITARKQAEAEIARRTADLAAQNAIAATLSRTFDLDATLAEALDVLLAAMNMSAGLVFLADGDTGELVLRSCRGQVAQEALQAHEHDWAACHAISRDALLNAQAVAKGRADSSRDRAGQGDGHARLRTWISAPLVSKGRVAGALTLGSPRADPVSASDRALLTAIGQQIGMAVENNRLYRSARDSAELLSRLHQVSIILTSTPDSARLYQQIVEQAAVLLDCQAAAILQWDDATPQVEMISSYGFDAAESDVLRAGPGVLACLRDLVGCHRSVTLDDASADERAPQAWREKLGIRALLCAPIIALEKSLGALFVLDRLGSRSWRPDDRTLMESFVNVAAIALTNADYHKQLEWAAALEERQRIAADMHDTLAQTVAVLSMRIDDMIDLTAKGLGHEALAGLSQVRTTADQAATDVRRSIAHLNTLPEPHRPLQELLCDLLQKFPDEDGAAIDFRSDPQEPLFLPQTQRAEALLVVQEALLNARRHAHAERIVLRLECSSPDVHITVEDNGVGFDPSARWTDSRSRFGLNIMRARAARAGARLSIDSAPGQGTRVALRLPIDCNMPGVQPDAIMPAIAREPGRQVGVAV